MTIENIIKNEVLTNCSQMIRQLSEVDMTLVECHFNIFIRDDFSEPPEGYEIMEYTTQGLPGVPSDRVLYQWVHDDSGRCEDGFSSFYEAVQDAFEDSGDEPPTQEALEHWIVSDWLADKLEEIGACIDHDVYGLCIWGRTETGQSLTMDSDLKAVKELVDWKLEQLNK